MSAVSLRFVSLSCCFCICPSSIKFLLVRRNDTKAAARILMRFRSPLVRDDLHFVLDEKPLPGASIVHLFTERRALGTLLLWVPFFMGFGILTVAVLWTPALLRLNGISPANTAFVVAFNGLGGFIGQSTAGRLIERFGILTILVPAFLLGAAATVGLGYGASSVALAATFIGLIGVFMGFGTGGAIALAATIYPTSIRSTGVGWGMAMGRFGQIVGPLLAGALLGAGWTADRIMTVIACGGLIARGLCRLVQGLVRQAGCGRIHCGGRHRKGADSPLICCWTATIAIRQLSRQHRAADDVAGAQIIERGLRFGKRTVAGRNRCDVFCSR